MYNFTVLRLAEQPAARALPGRSGPPRLRGVAEQPLPQLLNNQATGGCGRYNPLPSCCALFS